MASLKCSVCLLRPLKDVAHCQTFSSSCCQRPASRRTDSAPADGDPANMTRLRPVAKITPNRPVAKTQRNCPATRSWRFAVDHRPAKRDANRAARPASDDRTRTAPRRTQRNSADRSATTSRASDTDVPTALTNGPSKTNPLVAEIRRHRSVSMSQCAVVVRDRLSPRRPNRAGHPANESLSTTNHSAVRRSVHSSANVAVRSARTNWQSRRCRAATIALVARRPAARSVRVRRARINCPCRRCRRRAARTTPVARPAPVRPADRSGERRRRNSRNRRRTRPENAIERTATAHQHRYSSIRRNGRATTTQRSDRFTRSACAPIWRASRRAHRRVAPRCSTAVGRSPPKASRPSSSTRRTVTGRR